MREELRNQITNYTESVIESFGIHVPIYDIDRIVRDLGGEIVEGVTERWADGMLEPDKGEIIGLLFGFLHFKAMSVENLQLRTNWGIYFFIQIM